jgi:hypothetical protein
MSDFRVHRYNVLVLQQMSCGPSPGNIFLESSLLQLSRSLGFHPASLRLVKRIPLAD